MHNRFRLPGRLDTTRPTQPARRRGNARPALQRARFFGFRLAMDP